MVDKGVFRYETGYLTDPQQILIAYERVFRDGCPNTVGSLAVQYGFGFNDLTSATTLKWEDCWLTVQSPHTGSPQAELPIRSLPGVVRDRVYQQLAIPLNRMVKDRK